MPRIKKKIVGLFRRLLGLPKFKRGDLVAVCAQVREREWVVVPSTRVVDRKLVRKGSQITLKCGRQIKFLCDAYWYTVEEKGCDWWFIEHTLRPIRSDEYQEEELTSIDCGSQVERAAIAMKLFGLAWQEHLHR